MAGILHGRKVYAAEIIVVSVFGKIQAITSPSIDRIVSISVQIEETRVLIYAVADSIFIKVIPVNRIIMVVTVSDKTKALIAITVLIEEIQIAFNRVPSALNEAGPVIVTFSMICGHPSAFHQFAVFKLIRHLGEETALLTIKPLVRVLVEVVITLLAVFIREIPPAGLQHAVDGIIPRTVELEQTGDLALAGAGLFIKPIEVLAALIVEARKLLHALNSGIIYVVVGRAVDLFPAGPCSAVQDKLIREFLIRLAGEVAALRVDNVFRLLIGINIVLLLERCLAGHVVERVSTKIDVIAD